MKTTVMDRDRSSQARYPQSCSKIRIPVPLHLYARNDRRRI